MLEPELEQEVVKCLSGWEMRYMDVVRATGVCLKTVGEVARRNNIPHAYQRKRLRILVAIRTCPHPPTVDEVARFTGSSNKTIYRLRTELGWIQTYREPRWGRYELYITTEGFKALYPWNFTH